MHTTYKNPKFQDQVLARSGYARRGASLLGETSCACQGYPKAPTIYKYEKNQIKFGSDVEFVTYHGFDLISRFDYNPIPTTLANTAASATRRTWKLGGRDLGARVAAWSVQEACGGRDSRSGSSLQHPRRAGGWPGGWQPAMPLNGSIDGAGGERCGRAHAAVWERCDVAARGAYHNFNVILSIH
jgi:hypothetical protein